MGNVRDAWMAAPRQKAPKRKSAGRKSRTNGKAKVAPRLEQPIANSTGNVSCPICGHPVDPSRMHPHMVRFHGAGKHPSG